MKKLLLLFLLSNSLYAMNKNNADLEKEKRDALEQNIKRAFLAQVASKEKNLGFKMDKDIRPEEEKDQIKDDEKEEWIKAYEEYRIRPQATDFYP